MLIEVTREDLIRAIKGTGGPDKDEHLFIRVGVLISNKWKWYNKMLDDMDEYKLLELYKLILQFKKL